MATEPPVAAVRAVALTGADGPLGQRVMARLATHAATTGPIRLVVIGEAPPLEDADGWLEPTVVHAGAGVGARDLEDVDVVVHLAGGPGPNPVGPSLDAEGGTARLALLRSLLGAAAEARVGRVVHLSSALVYGAWADNPVPLSEDSPVRPDPAFPLALELAEAERLVLEWSEDVRSGGDPDAGKGPFTGDDGRRVAVLRPALVVAPDDEAVLVRALGGTRGVRAIDDPRPVQFVHVDDLADAVVLAITAGLAGPFNVAPEGWIDDVEAAALAGAALPKPALPARLVGPARRLGWALGIGATPPAAAAYATHPWVVAADRLRSRGWVAGHSNEEAIVDTTSASALATLSPRRRQELLLAAVAAVVLGVVGAGIGVVVRARRR